MTPYTRHVHITENQIRQMSPGQVHARCAGGRLKHLKPVLFQSRGQGAPEGFIVVDDQNLWHTALVTARTT